MSNEIKPYNPAQSGEIISPDKELIWCEKCQKYNCPCLSDPNAGKGAWFSVGYDLVEPVDIATGHALDALAYMMSGLSGFQRKDGEPDNDFRKRVKNIGIDLGADDEK